MAVGELEPLTSARRPGLAALCDIPHGVPGDEIPPSQGPRHSARRAGRRVTGCLPRETEDKPDGRSHRLLVCFSTTRPSRATAARCGSSSPTSGLEYETVDVSVVDRSNRQELLGALNPGLRVPTLVLDDGRPLAESNAILWFFGDATEYVPTDPYERAQVLQWQFFEQY